MLRTARSRRHRRVRGQEVWQTFAPGGGDSPATSFGTLECLDEGRLAPATTVTLADADDAMVVTYVLEGTIIQRDSSGRSGIVHAGEVQCMTVRRGIRRTETNPSRVHWAHMFRLRLGPSETPPGAGREQKRFCAGDRRAGLCLVASPDGRKGSLRVGASAFIYSAVLERGQHVVHELGRERRAWLHVVRGEAKLGDIVLLAGDGAGVTDDRAVSMTARAESEVLLVDVAAASGASATAQKAYDATTRPTGFGPPA